MDIMARNEARTSAPKPAVDESPVRDGVTIGLVAVVCGALGVMAVNGEIFWDAMVFLAAFVGLGAWAARRRSPRLRWAIAGLMTLFVGINLGFAVADLSHPESPAPFVVAAVVIVGGLVTIGLAVAAARHRRVPVTRIWGGAAVLLILLAGFSLVTAAAVTEGLPRGEVTSNVWCREVLRKDVRHAQAVSQGVP